MHLAAHHPAESHAPKPIYRQLYFQVLAAIVLGVTVGHFWPEIGASLKPLGDGFVKLVKMIIAPVIFLTVTTGIAGMSDLKKVGRVAGKAFAYFLTFSTLALVVGLVVGNFIQPGAGLNIDPATLDGAAVADYAAKAHDTRRSWASSPASSRRPSSAPSPRATSCRCCSSRSSSASRWRRSASAGAPVLNFLQAMTNPIFKLVEILMKAAPIGAFGAMAFTIGKYGIASVLNLAMLVGTFYLTAFLFVVVVLGAVAWWNGFSIFKLIRYLKEELLLVLGTSSSEAALPSLMEKMERAGAKRSVVGLVVPTGY